MRLFIHAAGIARGGGLRHLAGFLPALASVAPRGSRICLSVRSSVVPVLELAPPIEVVPVPDWLARTAPVRVAFDHVAIPALARARSADVLVSFANFGPRWAGAPHVVLQTNATYFSPLSLERASAAERAQLLLRREMTLAAMQGAKTVITPSEAMTDLVAEVAPWVRPACVCLHHGIDLSLFRAPSRRAMEGRPFSFLCPGIAAPYKGIDVVVPALARVRDASFHVRACGNNDDWPEGLAKARAEARASGVASRITFEPEVAFADIGSAYAEADALLYPTLCESFGFTLLEALAAGLPVVASDIPVNREIAGNAALYYDARSPTALAAAMDRIMADAALREELTEKAGRRTTEVDWSWRGYAERFWAICERARVSR